MIGEGESVISSPLVPRELSKPKCNLKHFCFTLIAVSIFGLTSSVILVTVFTWFGLFKNGFEWNPNTTLFNLHPTLMTLGLIAIPSLGVLTYRLFPFNKWVQKMIHAGIMLTTILMVVLAITAIEQVKFHSSHTHFWSIHSWCGLVTITLVCTQYLCGVVYLCPKKIFIKLRSFAVGWHRCFGLIIIWMATITILAGTSEQLIFGVSENKRNHGRNYENYAPEGMLGNVFALFVILNSMLLTVVLIGPMSQFLPKTEEA